MKNFETQTIEDRFHNLYLESENLVLIVKSEVEPLINSIEKASTKSQIFFELREILSNINSAGHIARHFRLSYSQASAGDKRYLDRISSDEVDLLETSLAAYQTKISALKGRTLLILDQEKFMVSKISPLKRFINFILRR